MTAFLFVLSLGYAQSELMPDLPNELAHDWYGLATWWPILAVVAFGIWVWWDRKRTRERLAVLEADVSTMKKALSREQAGHAATQRLLVKTQELLADTQKLLAASLRHLRDLWAWIHGGQTTPPPDMPDELHDQL